MYVAPPVIYSNTFSLMILKSGVAIWSVLARKVDPGVLEGGRENRPARCLSLHYAGIIRVSQNAPKCSLDSDIVHVAVSIPQEPPKIIW